MKRSRWFLLALVLAIAPLSSAQVNIVEEGFGPSRTGANLNETTLNISNVNSSDFGRIMSLSVDGEIFAQPLVVSSISIGGTTRNAVYVATMNDSVYCFDADTGASLWHNNFGTPVPTTTQNINGTYGIESTPYINLSTRTMYVVTDTMEQGAPTYRIHMLDIATGAEKIPSVVIAGSVPGNGGGSVSGTITFNASLENQRPGLAFASNMIFVAFASYSDAGAYHGFLFAYDATTLAQAGMFCDTPNGSSAGIWMSGGAPAVDQNGNLYLSTGNGDWDGVSNFGESFLAFSTGTDTFSLNGYFTPGEYATLNSLDKDFGASGPILLGNGLAISGSKASEFYLLNTANLGGMTQGNTQIPQSFANNGGGGILAETAFNPQSGLFYVWTGNGRSLNAYQFNSSSSSSNASPVAISSVLSQTGSQGGGLSVSANGSTPGTAIVWASIPAVSGGGGGDGVAGAVYAFDANTLVQLWNSNQNSARDSLGNWSKFRPPVVANGKVYVGTASGYLAVYGLLSSVTLTSSAKFNGTDTVTEGSWSKNYGTDGYALPETSGLPGYATFAANGAGTWTWAQSTSDPRAINGQATCWDNSAKILSFDINLTDGQSHPIALYLLDWDARGRSASIAVTDAATGAVLDSELASNFSNGVYYRWTVKGHVVIQLTPLTGPNAVTSGVFFGGGLSATTAATVTFLKSDTSTQGNWQGMYGSDGYSLAGSLQNIPSYASLTFPNPTAWVWTSSTSDPRALQTTGGRIAAAWYAGPSFSFSLNLNDGNAHQIGLYALDWDSQNRVENIAISDAHTGVVLDRETISHFSTGVYLVWSISGNVVITVTATNGPDAVISGVFFGGSTAASLAGTILMQLPSGVVAAAPSSLTIAPNQSQQITVTIINSTASSVSVTTAQQ